MTINQASTIERASNQYKKIKSILQIPINIAPINNKQNSAKTSNKTKTSADIPGKVFVINFVYGLVSLLTTIKLFYLGLPIGTIALIALTGGLLCGLTAGCVYETIVKDFKNDI